MLINKEYLKSLSPCEDRYKHYLTHYKDFEGMLEAFLDLPELIYTDKVWVFVRSIDKDKLRLVAADFAERVLHIYESKYPNDDRPRKAIEAARRGDKDADSAVSDAADDAYAVAYAVAVSDAAYAAAYAAAAAAAHAAYAAVYAAAYAAAAAAAAAYAAVYAARKEEEEQAQIEIMKKYAKGGE